MAVHADQDVFHGGQIGEQTDVLIGPGNPVADDLIREQAHQRVVIQTDIADFRAVKTRDAIKKGGFAGAVGSDDTVDALLFDLDIQVLNSDESAELFGDVCDGDSRHGFLLTAGFR